MATAGERATLRIVREHPAGVFLDAGPSGEVLLPRREVPPGSYPGDSINVFLYHDSEDRLIATRAEPLARPGQFAHLRVVAVNAVGAFLDWGLPKDLLVPFREQRDRLETGKSYVVHVHIDPESGRTIASRRLSRYLDLTPPTFAPGDEVELMIYGRSDLGYKAIINGTHSGLLFANEVFRKLHAGETTRGFIREIRPDGKIDLTLDPPGRSRVSELEAAILSRLDQLGGFWDLHDKSPTDRIYRELGVSKRTFKQAVGSLFRARKISIEPEGMRLLKR